MKIRLEDFLKAKGVYYDFIYNTFYVNQEEHKLKLAQCVGILKRALENNEMRTAFNWSKSDEGMEFWNKLYQEFMKEQDKDMDGDYWEDHWDED